MQGTHTSLVYDESGVVGNSVEESPQPDDDDSLARRRMKNRDRQRRYRARKRLEAEMKHAQQFITQQALVGQTKSELSSDNVGGVLCWRDWKTEARETHTIKKIEDAQYHSGITLLLPEMKTKSSPSSGSGEESDSHVFRRRDWKAAARNHLFMIQYGKCYLSMKTL